MIRQWFRRVYRAIRQQDKVDSLKEELIAALYVLLGCADQHGTRDGTKLTLTVPLPVKKNLDKPIEFKILETPLGYELQVTSEQRT